MKQQRQAEKHSPQHYAPTSKDKKQNTYGYEWNPVTTGKPAIVAVIQQIRCVARERGLTVILGRAPQYPADVSPPATVARRMGIACLICMRMVYAVRHYPLDWTTFESQRGAGHQKVFNCFRHLVTAVRQQTVIAHPDAQTRTNPVKDYRGDDGRPTPKKKRCNRSKMGDNKKDPGAPIPIRPIDLYPLAHSPASPTFF